MVVISISGFCSHAPPSQPAQLQLSALNCPLYRPQDFTAGNTDLATSTLTIPAGYTTTFAMLNFSLTPKGALKTQIVRRYLFAGAAFAAFANQVIQPRVLLLPSPACSRHVLRVHPHRIRPHYRLRQHPQRRSRLRALRGTVPGGADVTICG